MILHLITDHQVVERMLDAFDEVFPGQNSTLIFADAPLQRLKKYAGCKIISSKTAKEEGKSYDFRNVSLIMVHYMSISKIDFIKQAPSNIPVAWEVYGFDLYNQFLIHKGFDIYFNDIRKYSPHKIADYTGVLNMYRYIKGAKYVYPCVANKYFDYIAKRISHMTVCCPEDAVLFQKYSGRTIEYGDVINYSLKTCMGALVDKGFSSGNNILIGNSASFSNNHLYTLNFLSNIDLKDKKLILQLSYGNTSNYINDVVTKYKNTFGDNVIPVQNYLPLDEYNQTFLNMYAMIFSNWRQESLGTIYLGLYLGIKVYLSNKSPIYKWLKDIGMVVYETESLTQENLDTPMTIEEKEHNRKWVSGQLQHDRQLSLIREHYTKFVVK